MNIDILYDNQSQNPELTAGWGFSCIIDNAILFDTGESGPALLSNMRIMDIPLQSVRRIVISHDHWDHWGGLWDLLNEVPGVEVIGCRGFSDEFKERVASSGGRLTELDEFGNIAEGVYISKPIATEYSEGVLFERAVYCVTKKGLSVLTGCAHPGILAFAADAVEQFPKATPDLVLGGFHLGSCAPADIDGIIDGLRRHGFSRIVPTHCSGEYAASTGTEGSWTGKRFAV